MLTMPLRNKGTKGIAWSRRAMNSKQKREKKKKKKEGRKGRKQIFAVITSILSTIGC